MSSATAVVMNDVHTYEGEFVTPKSRVGRVIVKGLLLLSLHMYDTHRLRELVDENRSDEWKEFKSSFFTRIGNLTLVSSMVLATTASFLTTTPTSTVADWSHPWPYASIGLAFLLTYMSVSSGVFVMFFGMDFRPRDVRELSRDPTKFAFGLILIFLPSFFLYGAALAGVVSICGAVYHGSNRFAQVGLVFVAVIAAGLVVMLVISVSRTAAHRDKKSYEAQALTQHHR